jgi:hypothetical protein
LNVPEAELVELGRRIDTMRRPKRELVADDTQGVQLGTTQAPARYGATDYDWRKCGAKLNAIPQFVTEIEGQDVHFIGARSKHENALPLIVTHGWPGSIIPRALQEARRRRPLRRLGTAATLLRRRPRQLQSVTQITVR